MLHDIREFLAWHADDWVNASNRSRLGALIGAAVICAIAGGLLAVGGGQ